MSGELYLAFKECNPGKKGLV